MKQREIWEHVISNIKKDFKEDDVELWIKEATPSSFENGIFTLKVPNKFFQDWIKINCQTKIEAELEKITNQQTSLNIEIDNSSVPKPSTEIQKQAAVQISTSNHLFNQKYTFDTFVVGQNNRFAQAASFAVAKDPGKAYNPLFLYGGVGLGKTHLLHAIANYALSANSNLKVLYISSDKFVNELIEAIRNDKNVEFRNKYRNIDLLLIDDIQFLAGKESTQEEFFHTFNTLYDAHKQIVLTSDRTPKEINALEERLRSRFEWGIIADIQAPDLETRIAILRKKAETERINIDDDVLLYIANHIKTNIRELEGSLVRVAAFSLLTGSVINVDKAKDILKDIIIKENINVPITVDLILKVVSRNYNLSTKDLCSKKRSDSIAFPRQVAMYIARNLTELSTTEIGNSIGNRDHSTVMYACDKITKEIEKNPFFASQINKITNEIRSGE